MAKFKAFLTRKDIVFSAKRYGIDALGAMALGLFGSLLIGTIFNALGLIPGLSFFKDIGGYGAKAAGPAMAVAIAYALKAPPLVMYSAALIYDWCLCSGDYSLVTYADKMTPLFLKSFRAEL